MKELSIVCEAMRIGKLIASVSQIISNVISMIEAYNKVIPKLKQFKNIIKAKKIALSKAAVVMKKGFVAGIKALKIGLWAGIKAIAAFSAALLASPLTWVVAGIAAVVTAIVLLYKNWDKVSTFLTESWSSFVDFWAKTFKSMSEIAVNIWNNITGFLGAKIENIKLMFSDGFLNGIIGILREFHPVAILNDAINAIFGIDLIAIGKTWIQGFIDGVLDTVKNAAGFITKAIGGLIPQGMKNMAGGAVNAVKEVLPFFGDDGIVTRPPIAMTSESRAKAVVLPTKSDSINNNSRTNNIGSSSFTFSPNITVNGGGGGDLTLIQAAVTNALNEAKGQFERWYNDYQRHAARVAVA
jgi:hypothetical protein